MARNFQWGSDDRQEFGESESPYEESWRIYFDDHQDYHAIFHDPDSLTKYMDEVPKDIAFKIVNQDGIVVYDYKGKPLPMARAYAEGWKDTQSYPHGRKTLYAKTQEVLRPSAYRRPDAKGDMK